MKDTLGYVRPGYPLEPLAYGLGRAARAAYLSGRRDELAGMQQMVALIQDEVQLVPGLHHPYPWLGWGYRTGPESPRLASGDAWLVNSPRQDALLLSEFQLSPWGILAWGSDP